MLKLPVSSAEKKITYLLTTRGAFPRLDRFMIAVSDPYRWLLPTLGFAMILIYMDWQSSLRALMLGGAGSAIADAINTRVLKKNTDRIRPGKLYADIRSLGIMNRGKKSFPSNHASNTMAFAIGLSLIFPWISWIAIPLSILVGFSRIYCGAHFPLDVVAGWLHGALWVVLISQLFLSI